jgi:hypothetical protein
MGVESASIPEVDSLSAGLHVRSALESGVVIVL